jgi:hypothetical protein
MSDKVLWFFRRFKITIWNIGEFMAQMGMTEFDKTYWMITDKGQCPSFHLQQGAKIPNTVDGVIF